MISNKHTLLNFLIPILMLSMLMLISCDKNEASTGGNNYSEEQLRALGKVTVYGNTVSFECDPEVCDIDISKGGVYLHSSGVITFITDGLYCASLGHTISDEGGFKGSNQIWDTQEISVTKNGIERKQFLENPLAFVSEFFTTEDGFFGKLSDFTDNTLQEVEFGLPVSGSAQIYLNMPDNGSDWYEITIEYLGIRLQEIDAVIGSHGTSCADFEFSFSDARLPDDFIKYDLSGFSGSPIIQNGKLVGIYSMGSSEGTNAVANLAADLQFVLLQRYDENFDADMFKNVPTLKDYFD